MARCGESERRRAWSERLRRFARWDGTVGEFCDAERVSAPSFYQWKRKLAASGTAGAEILLDTHVKVDCFLGKPYQPLTLAEMVRRILAEVA